MVHVIWLLFVSWAGLGIAASASGQEPTQTPDTSLNDASLAEVKQQYNQATNDLRSSLKEIRSSSVRFFNDAMEQSDDHRQHWQTAVEQGKTQIKSLRAAAMELFRREDRPSDDVIDLALRSSLLDINEERYQVGLEILKRANSIRPIPRSELFMARVQLLDNEFQAANDFFKNHPDDLEELTETEARLYDSIDDLISQFEREKLLRERESVADDLPRVELITSSGKIVLELFENQAPQTVANFIHLVEQGYYNGVIFHNVKAEFVAQAGGFGVVQQDGSNRILPRGVRYTIYDENTEPDARNNFRGSLSMANQNSPDSASSQFFLSLTPQPDLNTNHTVFGRVIEGLSAMADLTVNFQVDDKGKEEAIEGAVPSMIFSAKVIRKRDHEYQPVKVGSSSVKAAVQSNKDGS